MGKVKEFSGSFLGFASDGRAIVRMDLGFGVLHTKEMHLHGSRLNPKFVDHAMVRVSHEIWRMPLVIKVHREKGEYTCELSPFGDLPKEWLYSPPGENST